MKYLFCTFVLLFLFAVPYQTVADDFRFIGGGAEQGKIAFENLNCVQCHRVNNVELQKPKTKPILKLTLGKETRFVKKYEDILTAITNPHHVVKTQYAELLSEAELAGGIEAFMPKLIEDMSVAQLIDLAAFLDKVYSENIDDYQKK